MIRRLAQAVWGLLLLAIGYGLVLDIWEALGRPGGRCPACRARYPWNPRAAHQCAPPRAAQGAP